MFNWIFSLWLWKRQNTNIHTLEKFEINRQSKKKGKTKLAQNWINVIWRIINGISVVVVPTHCSSWDCACACIFLKKLWLNNFINLFSTSPRFYSRPCIFIFRNIKILWIKKKSFPCLNILKTILTDQRKFLIEQNKVSSFSKQKKTVSRW